MSTPVEQIKERLGIADVVGSYLKLERAGSSLKAKCPFHNERTPSFFVSPARGSYYCFGCQAKGDIFTFVQEFEGLDFVGALRVLASRAGVELRQVDPKVRSQYARAYLLLEKATRFFQEQLERHAEARAYLETRGLKPETIASWRLGFAPNEWRSLLDHLSKEGIKPEEMEKVGLVKKALLKESSSATAPVGARYYDAFRGRIMFPITDSAGRVIAFSARILPSLDDGKIGKYINSPETALFRKSEALYGFDKAKLSIRQKDATILVEGQLDLLMAHQAGFVNAVASSGTALTLPQLERLKRLSDNLLVAFDSDRAGVKASERAIHLALSLGMNVRMIPLKEKDPADLIAKSPDEWSAAVASTKHVIDFLLDEILSSAIPEREKALRIEQNLLPLLRRLPSKVEQSHFLKSIAERSGLREDALWETVKKLPAHEVSVHTELTPGAARRSPQLERRVFGMLFYAEELNRADEAGEVRKRLIEVLGEDEFKRRFEVYRGEKDALLAEIEFAYGTNPVPKHEEEELMRNLEEEAVSAAFSKTMDELALAEREGRKGDLTALLERCKKLSERLSALKAARYHQ